MTMDYDVFVGKERLVITGSGRADLESARKALRNLRQRSRADVDRGVLLDLRDVACDMTVTDVYELAQELAWPEPLLPRARHVAVLDAGPDFDKAAFLALCSRNRGLSVEAFERFDEADAWLRAGR